MLSKLLFRIRDFVTPSTRIDGVSTPEGEFVKGINFAGDAVTIEGYLWNSYETALRQGLSVPNATTLTTKITPKSYAPADVRRMLNGVIYKPQVLDIYQSLPNGNYDVYLWIMENHKTNWHALEIKIDDVTVATAVGQLPVKQWKRYGPYAAIVENESLHISINTNNPNVDAHIMGMSIFRVP